MKKNRKEKGRVIDEENPSPRRGEKAPLLGKTAESHASPFISTGEAVREAFNILLGRPALRAPVWSGELERAKHIELAEAWGKLLQLDIKDDKAARDPFLLGVAGVAVLISSLATAWLRREGGVGIAPANLTTVVLSVISFLLTGLAILIFNMKTELNSNRTERITNMLKYKKYLKKANEPSTDLDTELMKVERLINTFE